MARYLQLPSLVLKKFLILLTVVLLSSFNLLAQSSDADVFSPIGKYLVMGDIDKLSSCFDDNLEVSILAHSSTASREQARQILKTFFESRRPQTFRITHSSEDSTMKYAMGVLDAGGSSYMVMILLNNGQRSYKIQQIRIENN